MTILRKPIASINLFGKSYVVILSNLIASAVFFTTGILALGLTATGKFSAANMDVFTRTITGALNIVNGVLGNNIFLNILFVAASAYFIYWVSKRA